MNLYVFTGFNNYYNRIVKYFDALADYQTRSEDERVFPSYNFNPGDGIATEAVVNLWNRDEDGSVEYLDWIPDYLLVTDADGSIESRWFVLSANRVRGGQYRLALKRDVLADHYDEVSASKAYVQKGIITDPDDPFVLNSESLPLNQIKKDEILLKDRSGVAWLVLYLAKETLGSDTQGTVDLEREALPAIPLPTTFEDWPYYKYIAKKVAAVNRVDWTLEYYKPSTVFNSKLLNISSKRDGAVTIRTTTDIANYTNGYTSDKSDSSVRQSFLEGMTDADPDSIFDLTLATMTDHRNQDFVPYDEIYDSLMAFDGKTVRDTAGRYFRIKVSSQSAKSAVYSFGGTSAWSSELRRTFTDIWNSRVSLGSQSPREGQLKLRTYGYDMRVEATELPAEALSWSMAGITAKTENPLFDVLAIPYGDIDVTAGSQTVRMNKDVALSYAYSIVRFGGTPKVYDLQLLPYCPIQSAIQSDGSIYYPSGESVGAMVLKTADDEVRAMAFVAPFTDFTFDLPYSLSEDESIEDLALRRKVSSQCEFYRLCSPNYNGLFEFSLAKNGGFVPSFNVDVTLKPHNPYIHVNPAFSGLYGSDFDDSRGLVCQGDFSLGLINDQWTQYEIQNKNYQNIFNRQIENMDVTHKYSMIGQGVSAGLGLANQIANPSAMGIAGSVIGSGTSMALAELGYRESRSFAIDNFNMALDNVKALPLSITKTSALTANNKIFPFIEAYDCTEEEKNAFIEKIRFDGMTVGRIDTLADWMEPTDEDFHRFLRAELLRNTAVKGTSQVISAINDELLKGVYL